MLIELFLSHTQAQEVVASDSAEQNPMPVATLESVDENSKRLLESLGKLVGRTYIGVYVLGSGLRLHVGYNLGLGLHFDLGFGLFSTNLYLCVVNSWQTLFTNHKDILFLYDRHSTETWIVSNIDIMKSDNGTNYYDKVFVMLQVPMVNIELE